MASEEKEQRKPLISKTEKGYGGIISRTTSVSSDTSSASSESKSKRGSKKKRKVNKVTLSQLFSYADCLDRFLITLGTIFALIHGAGWPILAIVFGDMTNTFIQQSIGDIPFVASGQHAVNYSEHFIGFPTPLSNQEPINDVTFPLATRNDTALPFVVPNVTQSAEYFVNISDRNVNASETTTLPSEANEINATFTPIKTSAIFVNNISSDSSFSSKTPSGINDFTRINSTLQQPTKTVATTKLPKTSKSNAFEGLSASFFEIAMTAFSLYYVYIGIAVFFAAAMQVLCWQVSCERQIYKLRQEFFYQVLRQEIGWFDKHESGELSMKLNDDLERIREGIGDKFSMLIQHSSTFLSGFVVGFIKGWQLTLVIMSMSPLVALTSAFMGKLVASSTTREQAKYAVAGSVAEEVIGNIRTVTSLSGQRRETKRYSEALNKAKGIAIRKYYWMALALGMTFLILYGTYALAFWYGSELILGNKMNAGEVFTVFFAVMIGSFSLGNAAPHLSSVATAMGSAVKVFQIIAMRPAIDSYLQKGIILENFSANIDFCDVNFSYPTRRAVKALNSLSMNITEGQTVALCGASGSGKSTVIGLLLRFYDPSSGFIRLNGHDIKKLNLRWLRSIIGVVSQEPVLFGSTIKENIQYGRQDVTFPEVVEAAKMANAHQFIAALPMGYDTLVGERGAQLSGGQKQRISIARALVRNPKILLLDEATSALDSESEAVVQQALDKAREGRTTIVVAHRLSTIKNAEVIYAMSSGTIVESGTHEQLMNKEGLYHDLVMNQMFIDETGYSTTEANITEKDLVFESKRTTSVLKGKPKNDESFSPVISATPKEEIIDLPSSCKIVSYAGKEWKEIFLGAIASVIVGASMPVFAIFYSEIFNTFTLIGDDLKDAAFFWSMMFLVLASATAVGHFLRTVGFGVSGESLTSRLRDMAFKNILRQDIGWFDDDRHSSGKLSTRLATDVPMVKTAAGHRIGVVVASVVTLATSIVIAFIFGWKLALALTAAVPILLAAGAIEMKLMKGNQKRDAELMADAGNVVTECLGNIRTVQSLTQEPLFLEKYINNLLLPYTENKKHAIVYGLAFAFSQGVIFFIYSGAFRLGAYLVGNGEMDATNVYRVFFAMAFSAISVGQWISYFPDYAKAQLSAGHIFSLINTKPGIDSYSHGGIQPTIRGEVTFTDVNFKYPSRSNVPVLQGISLTVKPGETLALVGPSGCGKSTVIALLQRFYDPEQGQVKVDDFDIRTINLMHLRNHVAVVSQEPVLFNCTIAENIKYGVEEQFGQSDVESAAKEANIHDFINALPKGYNTLVGERGAQLSGGQKQRVAIARALIRNPRILLLDEATSALDTESEKVVQDALDKARQGRTSIVIAHRLSTVQNADCIAVVDKGKVVEQGAHDDLIKKKGIYYKLTKRQRIKY